MDPSLINSTALRSLADLQLSKQQERERIKAFQERLRAAGPNVNASWELVGLSLWLVKAKQPRWGTLLIRVDSDDLVQILMASIIIARDVINADKLDHVDVQTIGKWFGSDVETMLDPIVELIHSPSKRFPGREDWTIRVKSDVPTDRELAVARTWKKLVPPEYFEGRYRGI